MPVIISWLEMLCVGFIVSVCSFIDLVSLVFRLCYSCNVKGQWLFRDTRPILVAVVSETSKSWSRTRHCITSILLGWRYSSDNCGRKGVDFEHLGHILWDYLWDNAVIRNDMCGFYLYRGSEIGRGFVCVRLCYSCNVKGQWLFRDTRFIVDVGSPKILSRGAEPATASPLYCWLTLFFMPVIIS